MGICFGKEKPARAAPAPRQRIGSAPGTPARPGRPVREGGASAPRDVVGAGSKDDAGSRYGGTSFTDRRQEEADEMRLLMENAAQNFIEVSGGRRPLDAKDMGERSRMYEGVAAGPMSVQGMSAFTLPATLWADPARAVAALRDALVASESLDSAATAATASSVDTAVKDGIRVDASAELMERIVLPVRSGLLTTK